MPENEALFGHLAVELGLISRDQLVDATQLQNDPEEQRQLGDLLVHLKWITPEQLREVLAEQARRRQASSGDTGPIEEDGPEAASVVAEPRAAIEVDLGSLEQILEQAVDMGVSDVHLHTGSRPRFRLHGVLMEVGQQSIGDDFVPRFLPELLDAKCTEELANAGQTDFSIDRPGLGRFRGNAYRQQEGIDLVLRVIPGRVRDLEELGLGSDLARFTTYHQGLVLVTGPSGCGKTSTLAALVNIINQERRDHIITAEDPIEYIHESKRCLINQRQVGVHSQSFPRVLRAALREDPDVIVLGELRDLETVSLALTAAETGHLVLGTLHTGGAIRTISRLIGLYPPDEQEQMRVMLAESLRAVISQRLLTRIDGGGRVPAVEIMIVTRAISNLIRENKLFQIPTLLQTGRGKGMRMLPEALDDLVEQGLVTREEADKHA